MNKTVSLFLRYFLIAAFIILMFIFLYPCLKYSTAWGEALFHPYYKLFYNDHGWFFCGFITTVTNKYLPEILKMHHQDYMSKYNIYFILGIYITFILSLLGNFEKYFNKKTYSAIAIFLIGAVAIILQYCSNGDAKLWWFNHDIWFYGYIFNSLFPIFLFSRMEKYYVTEQTSFSKYEIISFIIFVIITAFGHEYYRVLVITTIPLVFIFNNLLCKNKIEFEKFFLFYISLVIVNSLLLFNNFFQMWIVDRARTLNECIKIFIPYIKDYCHTVILNNIFLFMMIIILSVVSILLTKNSEKCKKILIFSYSVIFSILFFNLIIIFGTEQYEFSFNHPGVIFITKIMLFWIILSLLGYLLSENQKVGYKSVIVLFMAILGIAYCYQYKYCFNTQAQTSYEKTFRQKIYLFEKMFVAYGKDHKTAYIFDDVDNRFVPIMLYEFLYKYDSIDKINDYKYIEVEDDINKYLELYKEKTGLTISPEELEECKFSNINKIK